MVILTVRSNSGSLVSAKAYRKVQSILVPDRRVTELACYSLDLGKPAEIVKVEFDWTYVVEAPTKENIRDWVKSETALSITQDTTGECVTGPLEDGYCSRGTIGCKVDHNTPGIDSHRTHPCSHQRTMGCEICDKSSS